MVNPKTQTLKLFNHGKQEHLGQDPEHFDHRTYRHRHHLRSDFVHGRVKHTATSYDGSSGSSFTDYFTSRFPPKIHNLHYGQLRQK